MPRRRPTIYFHGWILVDESAPPSSVEPGISPQTIGTFSVEYAMTKRPWRYSGGLPVNLPHISQDPLKPAEPGVIHTIWLHHPLGWDGYAFTLLGTVATADDPREAPRFVDGSTSSPVEVIAWRRQVYVERAESVLTVDWDPVTGLHEYEHCPGYTLSRQDAKQLRTALDRGWGLLASKGARGPKPGSGFYTNIEECFLRVKDRVRDLKSQGITPTLPEIAKLMNDQRPPTRQLERWYEGYRRLHGEVPWATFVEQL